MKRNTNIRSMLFIPGHKKNFISTIDSIKSDCIVFDLEDSVPASKKKQARKNLKDLKKNNFIQKEIYVRINSEKKNYEKDIKIFSKKIFNGVVIPKIESDKDVKNIERKLSKFNKKAKIFVIIETAKAIVNLKKICKSTKKLSGLIFGAEDYLNDINTVGFNTKINLNFPRSAIPIFAHAFKIQAIDTPYLSLKNFKGYKKHLINSKSFGYTGILNVHPKQCKNANLVYYPTKNEIKLSKLIINSNKKQKYQNQNISVLKNKLVGPPMIKRAKKIISFLK